jgi:hypothetical protein
MARIMRTRRSPNDLHLKREGAQRRGRRMMKVDVDDVVSVVKIGVKIGIKAVESVGCHHRPTDFLDIMDY